MVGRLLNGPSNFDLDLQSHSHSLSQEPTFSTVKFQASSLEDIPQASTGTPKSTHSTSSLGTTSMLWSLCTSLSSRSAWLLYFCSQQGIQSLHYALEP